MNHYEFSDIYMGQTESFDVMIGEEMLKQFEQISLDHNLLHKDSDYAKKNGYKDKICYGMLTASFLSALAGCYLPGERSLIQSINLSFPEPVYCKEKLTVIGEVVQKIEAYNTIKISVTIMKEDDSVAVRGYMLVGVREG